MFKRILKTVLPSFVRGQPSPDYFYFERTRKLEEAKEAIHSQTIAGDTVRVVSMEATQTQRPPSHDEQFLCVLFGQSDQKTELDPLSEYITLRVEELLLEPQRLLEELPVMPSSITQLLQILKSSEFEVRELVQVIEREPSMAADVVKLANVLQPSTSGREVTNLTAAFMTMGADGLMEGIIHFYVDKFTPLPNAYFKVFGQKIWEHSQQTAQFAKQVIDPKDEDPATAYFVGLIRNLGKMVIFQLLIEAFAHVNPDATPKSLAFKKLIAQHATPLTLAIARYWELPKPVLLALALQGNCKLAEYPLARAIFEGNRISELKMLLDSKRVDRPQYEERVKQLLVTRRARDLARQIIA